MTYRFQAKKKRPASGTSIIYSALYDNLSHLHGEVRMRDQLMVMYNKGKVWKLGGGGGYGKAAILGLLPRADPEGVV